MREKDEKYGDDFYQRACKIIYTMAAQKKITNYWIVKNTDASKDAVYELFQAAKEDRIPKIKPGVDTMNEILRPFDMDYEDLVFMIRESRKTDSGPQLDVLINDIRLEVMRSGGISLADHVTKILDDTLTANGLLVRKKESEKE